jgi:ubiquinone/menaquinone biosynthesis C-methylase UbiE
MVQKGAGSPIAIPRMNTRLLARAARPAIYAGRFSSAVQLDGAIDDRQIVAGEAIAAVANSSALIILDAMSFPWEMHGHLVAELPVYLVLPEDMTLEDIEIVFAKPLCNMTFCDRVIVPSRAAGRALSRRHGWARCQWKVRTGPMQAIADSLLFDLETRERSHRRDICNPSPGEELAYWRQRGALLASRAPERAVGTVRHSLRVNKHMHQRQSAAIEHALRLVGPRHPGWTMVEIGCGVGRWVPLFARHGAQYAGIDGSVDAVAACRRNHRDVAAFVADARGPLPIRDGSLDLVAFITVLHHLADEGKVAAIGHAWRALRPCGRLLMFESFVGTAEPGSTTIPVSWAAMQAMLVDGTRNSAVLEHFETITYRHVAETRSALVVVSKLDDRPQ